ncbi:hypothetical protein [Halorussus sp. MSC15.2]|uniref:hypothetical protein n=1 Tax=Halorussus sp. MSC15.2 TaxID=2283638 RepID=UPI0013D048AB|nr:hypothetical protein [Halorussus sp. MSC15.2]NEU58510.1 hypothetical protein [Halorussus sp. MSC15.2]
MMGNENSDITANEEALQGIEGGEAYMFQNQFFPEGEFHVVSTQLQNIPTPGGVGEGQFLTEFNNRLIQYTNAKNTFAFFFPYADAEVSQGVLYRLGGDWEDINEDGGGDGGGETPRSNLINVTFEPVRAEDEF